MTCLLLVPVYVLLLYFCVFNATATTQIYTLSLHDALPISHRQFGFEVDANGYVRNNSANASRYMTYCSFLSGQAEVRSEEHTSELQSLRHLVCRLLLEKKKKPINENM